MLTAPRGRGSEWAFARSVLFVVLSLPFFAFFGAGSSLRSDEVWSLRTVSMPYGQIMEEIRGDVHPPLYYYMLRGWVRVAGTGERRTRSLSGLLYILTALAVLGAGRTFFDTPTALLCCAIFLTSPLALLSAQFVRMYALLGLFSALSCWFYLEWNLRPRESRRALVLYVAANIFGTFTHVWFFFLLFAQGVCQLVWNRRQLFRKFVPAMSISLAPYAVLWLPTFLGQLRTAQQGVAWITKPTLGDFAGMLFLQGGALWVLAPILLYLYWKRRGAAGGVTIAVRWAGLLLAVAVGTPFLVSFVKPVFWARFTIIGLPLFALGAGGLIGGLANHQLEKALIVIAAAGVVYGQVISPACQSRWTAEYLARNAREQDMVIFTSLSRLPVDHYWDQIQPRRQVLETSFPAEIDKHPGHESPAPESVLREETNRLIEEIRSIQRERGDMRVFFLHGFRPAVDEILKNRLDRELRPLGELSHHCASMGSYLDSISVYEPALHP